MITVLEIKQEFKSKGGNDCVRGVAIDPKTGVQTAFTAYSDVTQGKIVTIQNGWAEAYADVSEDQITAVKEVVSTYAAKFS